MHSTESLGLLADQQVAYMTQDITLADDATDYDIVRGALFMPFVRAQGAPFERLAMGDFKQGLDLLLTRSAERLNDTTHKALGFACARSMLQVGCLVPTVLERSFGECIATIGTHVDLTSIPMKQLGNLSMPSGGRESVMDEVQAAGQTWATCPKLFMAMHEHSLKRGLHMLGRLELKELPGQSRHPDNWTRQLDFSKPDLGPFLAGVMTHLAPRAEHLQQMVMALGALEIMGASLPSPGQDVAMKWAKAHQTQHQSGITSKDRLQSTGSVLIQRLALGSVATDTARKNTRAPRM